MRTVLGAGVGVSGAPCPRETAKKHVKFKKIGASGARLPSHKKPTALMEGGGNGWGGNAEGGGLHFFALRTLRSRAIWTHENIVTLKKVMFLVAIFRNFKNGSKMSTKIPTLLKKASASKK